MIKEQRIKHKSKYEKNKEYLKEEFGIVEIDGRKEQIGNLYIEPAGFFSGRGCHPLMGKFKRRIVASDITINIGLKEKVPKIYYTDHLLNLVEIQGAKWGSIIHDNTLRWIASWKKPVTEKMGYVWLGAESEFIAESDREKFDKAIRLGKIIESIRDDYMDTKLYKEDIQSQQLACCMHLIDKFALRVGNEKGDSEADTVGVTSLKVSNLKMGEFDGYIYLDFLGKDSIPYVREVDVDVDVYDRLREFTRDKNEDEFVFDMIDSNYINEYLHQFMPDLTAKVFRTYNACKLFYDSLLEITKNPKMKLDEIIYAYTLANIKVAKLCNHQKGLAKGESKSILNLKEKIKNMKKSRERNLLKQKLELKVEMESFSLSTSKINYIDPRITFWFVKKMGISANIDKFFDKKLLARFKWASDTTLDYSI